MEDKLLKVTLEFEGKIQTLEGEEANSWLKELNSAAFMSAIHGMELSKRKWKIVKKEVMANAPS